MHNTTHPPPFLSSLLFLSLSLSAISSLSYTASYVYLHNQIAQKSIMKTESYASFMDSSLAFVLFFWIILHFFSMISSLRSPHTFSVFFSPTLFTKAVISYEFRRIMSIQSDVDIIQSSSFTQSETVPVRCFVFDWKYSVWLCRRQDSNIINAHPALSMWILQTMTCSVPTSATLRHRLCSWQCGVHFVSCPTDSDSCVLTCRSSG